jgi:hypothetical protein
LLLIERKRSIHEAVVYCATAGELHAPPVENFHACFPLPPLIA